jgi:hypothetical protein
MRTKTYAFKRLRDDLAALGWRHRRGHDLRRTLISLARTDGARKDILELCTHTPRKGSAIDVPVGSLVRPALSYRRTQVTRIDVKKSGGAGSRIIEIGVM